MDDSIAHPLLRSSQLNLPGWKSAASHVCAALIAILFVIAGTWKITDPVTASTLMTQALVPQAFALPLAILLGIGETFGAVLLFVPRFRRWGATIIVFLLAAFLIYFAIFYGELRGRECNCFPWIKRTVGPGFFIGDAIMLTLAAIAGFWARRAEGLRTVAIILGAVAVFAAASYGVTVARQTGTQAPDSITVDGKPYSLQSGQILIFFFDPECSHCDESARRMAKYHWGDTKVIGIPTAQPQFGPEFMTSTGLHGLISNDLAKMKAVFPFINGPYAVALRNGRQVAALPQFDADQPKGKLKELGFIE